MDDLIKLLEAMTGPARSVDVEIGRLQGVLVMQHDEETGVNREHTHWEYTKSIDDALSLVPDGWAWFVERIDGFSNGDARLWLPAQRARGYIKENFDVRNAANPAIAICIAALKARAAIAKTALKSQENTLNQ